MSVLQDKNVDLNGFETDNKIDQFVIQVPTVESDVEGFMVKKIFDKEADVEGIVVMENGRAVGIVMRTAFYQKMGSLYGHSLYSNRPVSILMESSVMIVDVNDNISKIGVQAMDREQSKLHDYIVVLKNNTYFGVISIRLFLVELSKRNDAQINVLKHQQKKLMSANEQETLLRKDLEYQSASVRNLLDHADQGFLWFDSNFIVKKEYSYKCMDIFNKSIGGESYLQLMSNYFDKDKLSVFHATFDSYFKNNSPITDNVYLMLLPTDCLILGKNIHFEYRRIESDGEKAVMVVLNDVTERINLEKSIEEDRNRQRLLIKAFSYQAQIKQLLDEFYEIFSHGYLNFFSDKNLFHDGLNELFRSVHTFKGDFAQYGFISTSDQIHIIEDELLVLVNRTDEVTMSDVEQIMNRFNPKELLKADSNVIYDVLGSSYFDQSEILTIPKSKLDETLSLIQNDAITFDKTAIIHLIRKLKLKNAKVFLNQYQDYLHYLSGRVLKNTPIYIVEGDDIEIDRDMYGDFFKSLVHIFRNIMDHGIETDEERLEYGKPERGLVECQISRLDSQWFTIRISDDGRGIDLNKLRAKAIVNRLYSEDEINKMTENEISDLIFADHLSTKDASNALSGRGVGMPAFRQACIKLGGKIEVLTEESKGTTFIITLPYSN